MIKVNKAYGLLGALLLCTCFFSCIKPEDGFPNTNVIDTINKFTVTNYRVNGSENSTLFAGWEFQFGSNLRIQASKNGQTFQGEWRQFGDSLVIYNLVDAPLNLLNKSWGRNIINDKMIYTQRGDAAGTTELNFDAIK
jgi:hypothetical protein